MKSKSRYAKFTGIWLCFALLAMPGVTTWGRAASSTAHLTEANTLLNNLSQHNSQNNQYDDDAAVESSINWDGSEAFTNCGTFVTLLLKHTYNWTNSDFSSWWQTTSPNAARYHDAIVANDEFTRIFTRTQIQPGDFIAIKYPEEENASGHMMMVAETPTLLCPNPTMSQVIAFAVIGTPYKITVIDSSSSYHGSTDTRNPDNDGNGEGIGQGVVVIYFDASGQVVAYKWSDDSNSPYIKSETSGKHLVIGRLQ